MSTVQPFLDKSAVRIVTVLYLNVKSFESVSDPLLPPEGIQKAVLNDSSGS